MINLDQQNPQLRQQRPAPQPMVPQGAAAGQQAAGQQPAGPAVLFRGPQAQAPVGQPTAAAGQPPGPGQPASGPQPQPQKPISPLERFQMEQAKLQELYGIIGQAQAKLDAVRAAMGKKPTAGTQYEQAVKGSGHANR